MMWSSYSYISVSSSPSSVVYLLVSSPSQFSVPKGMCYSLTISSLNAELVRSTFINKSYIFNITSSHLINWCQKLKEKLQLRERNTLMYNLEEFGCF